MKLEKIQGISHELKQLNDYFLHVQISITNEELKQLLYYQVKVCKQLEWIEMDKEKLQFILAPIIQSPYFYQEDCVMTLKRIIFSYYNIRKKFDHTITDDEICRAIEKEYAAYFGAKLNTIVDRVENKLVRDGGIIRHESTF